MSSFKNQELAARVECSPAKPWGIHSTVLGNRCSRCGWIARAHRAAAAAAAASGRKHGRRVVA